MMKVISSLFLLVIIFPSIIICTSDTSIPIPSTPTVTTTKYDETIETPRDLLVWDGIPRPYAVLMTFGSCTIRNQYRNVVRWIKTEAKYYHDLDIKFVGDAPRIKFYRTKEARDQATVDSSLLSVEEMMKLLNEPRQKPAEIPFTLRLHDEMKPEQISALIEKYGGTRGFPTKEVPDIPE